MHPVQVSHHKLFENHQYSYSITYMNVIHMLKRCTQCAIVQYTTHTRTFCTVYTHILYLNEKYHFRRFLKDLGNSTPCISLVIPILHLYVTIMFTPSTFQVLKLLCILYNNFKLCFVTYCFLKKPALPFSDSRSNYQ